MPLLMIAALAGAMAPGQPEPMPKDLARASAAWDAAQIKGDKVAIQHLLADDYVLVSGSGALETKTQFAAELVDPAFKQEPFTVEQPIVRVWNDGAVLGGVARARGTDHGHAFDARIRFADIWAKRGGEWRLVYTHVSKP